MHIWSLTQEKLDDLNKLLNQRIKDLEYITSITSKNLWKNDLENIM